MAKTKSESKSYDDLYQSIRKEVEKELKDARIAARNVLDDLQIEKDRIAEINAKDEAILESIGEGVIAVDNDKKIIVVNKVAINMLGWKIKDLIGKEITNLPLEDEMGNAISLHNRPSTIALKTGKSVRVTLFFVRRDKTRFPMAITVTPIKLKDKIIGLIEIIRDITHEKEVDQAKSEFVSLASHQLRTPLTTISWYTEMILRGDMGLVVPDQKKYLEEIYLGNKRMIELVNTLLDVSRLELGTFAMYPEPMQIKDVAESVLAELEIQIESKGVILDKNYDPRLPVFNADPKLINIIFQNLLGNAVKYSAVKGKINFDISIKGLKVLIKIWNNGIEIPLKAQSKIFTKLFRGDLAKQVDPNGSGLGLYIVKSIVENSGGEIWFKSPAGKGITFYVTLPLNGIPKKHK